MQSINSSRVYLEAFVKSAASAVLPGSYVLDAGAGNCLYKPLFKDMHYESADFCQADKAYGEITYVCELSAIPVPNDRYDLVICTQVLEHVQNPKEILAELFRVLKPGGALYASAPLFYEEHEIPHDYFRYTRFGLQYLLESTGFQARQLQPLEGYFGTLSYQLRTYPKTAMSHRMLAQANWTKANQLVDFLHQRVRTLRRFVSQPNVRSTTQRRAGNWVSPGAGHGSGAGSPRLRLRLMCAT